MFVLTVDQRSSRGTADAVPEQISALRTAGITAVLDFERTAGDEFQGLLDDASSVLTVMLTVMRSERWHLGVGVGPVDVPLPTSTREARGPAFLAARRAVEEAKAEPSHLAVRAGGGGDEVDAAAADVQAVLRAVEALYRRRTAAGWAAVAEAEQGRTLAEAGRRLGVSAQAVQQRLAAAGWATEAELRPALVRLLARGDALAAEPSDGAAA